MKKLLLIIGILFCFVSTAWAADVTLAWDPLTVQTDGVAIFIGLASGDYSWNYDAGIGTSQATVDKLVPGTEYFFAAKAYRPSTGEWSGFSNEVSYTVPVPPITMPLPPLPDLPPNTTTEPSGVTTQ